MVSEESGHANDPFASLPPGEHKIIVGGRTRRVMVDATGQMRPIDTRPPMRVLGPPPLPTRPPIPRTQA